jgi:hypothetical protein
MVQGGNLIGSAVFIERKAQSMHHGYRLIGFVVIAILYVVVGIMAALGTITIFRKMFGPKSEQTLYAMFLIGVAALYLAFLAYFGAASASHLETIAVIVFVAIALLGLRLPFALIIGYSLLHGLWDMAHELQAHGGHSWFEPGQLTAIPLAYGFFCAAFDLFMAAYFYRRRVEWNAARKA